MSYNLSFTESAKKEYDKLDSNIRDQFKKKLRGSNTKDRYKIKLRSAGYRLLYEVIDDEVVVLVIAIGKRDSIYKTLNSNLSIS